MNTPNLITVGRLLLAVASFAIVLFFDAWSVAGIIILIAVLLDILDGRIARHLSQVTKEGIFLDVMADKIVIISTFLIVGLKINIVFFYLGILMLIREYAMDTMRGIAASKHQIISADKYSKIKGVLFMVAMLGMIWNKILLENNDLLQDLFVVIAVFAMILAYITLARFFFKYKNLLIS